METVMNEYVSKEGLSQADEFFKTACVPEPASPSRKIASASPASFIRRPPLLRGTEPRC
jgi:hypothetical protein